MNGIKNTISVGWNVFTSGLSSAGSSIGNFLGRMVRKFTGGEEPHIREGIKSMIKENKDGNSMSERKVGGGLAAALDPNRFGLDVANALEQYSKDWDSATNINDRSTVLDNMFNNPALSDVPVDTEMKDFFNKKNIYSIDDFKEAINSNIIDYHKDDLSRMLKS